MRSPSKVTEPSGVPDPEEKPSDPDDTAPEYSGEPTGDRHRMRPGVVLAVLATVLALAVGFLVGVWVAHPPRIGDDSPEAGFARDMITHHGQAVSMAVAEYDTTTDPHLRQVAIDIALTQQAQLGMMQTWLRTWGLPPTSPGPPMAWMSHGASKLLADGRMPGMASAEQMAELRQATGRAKDILFCRLMIVHHLSGIHMVEGILAITDNSEVRTLAETMKEGQQYEVATLQEKLEQLTR